MNRANAIMLRDSKAEQVVSAGLYPIGSIEHRGSIIMVVTDSKMDVTKYTFDYDTKICSKCGCAKDIDSFAINARASDSRQSWCRDCHKKYQESKIALKKCSSCGELLHFDMFGIRNDSRDGLNHACKECERARGIDYRRRKKDYRTQNRQNSGTVAPTPSQLEMCIGSDEIREAK